MPTAWLSTHQQLADELRATPVSTNALPAMVGLLGGAIALLTRDLFNAQILRASAPDPRVRLRSARSTQRARRARRRP